jgi:hypothetical protein
MFNFFKIILFSLILIVTFAACSKIDITHNSVPEVQNKSVAIKSSEFKFTEITISDDISFMKGARTEICWAFPYVRYNGQSYEISLDKEVKKSKIGRQIGAVKRLLPSSMVLSGEKFVEKDGDSNYLAEGSFIYAVKGKDVNESIIVDDNGVFKEAIPYSN